MCAELEYQSRVLANYICYRTLDIDPLTQLFSPRHNSRRGESNFRHCAGTTGGVAWLFWGRETFFLFFITFASSFILVFECGSIDCVSHIDAPQQHSSSVSVYRRMFRPEQHSRLQSLVFLFEKAFYFFVDDGHEPVMGTRPHPKCIEKVFIL